MIFDLSTLQKEQSPAFTQGQAGIIQSHDQLKRERYFFTFAEKKGALFDDHINVVLMQEANSSQCFLFFEKTVKMRDQLGLTPSCETTKLIRINLIKLVARKKNNLALIILTEKQKLEQMNIKFASQEIARKWQNLIYTKKNSPIQVDNNDRVDLSAELKQTKARLKFCEEKLIQERMQKEDILKHLSIVTERLIYSNRTNSLLESQVNEVMCTNLTGNNIESDQRIQQLQERCKEKQTELNHLKLRVRNLLIYKKNFEEIFMQMEAQLNGCRKQMSQLVQRNQALHDKIKISQEEKDNLLDKVLQRNMQIRNNQNPANKSVMIDNKQDLAMSIEYQSFLLSFKS